MCVCVWPCTSVLNLACSRKVRVEKIFRLIYMRRFACTRTRITSTCFSYIYIYICIYEFVRDKYTRYAPSRPAFQFYYSNFILRKCRTDYVTVSLFRSLPFSPTHSFYLSLFFCLFRSFSLSRSLARSLSLSLSHDLRERDSYVKLH